MVAAPASVDPRVYALAVRRAVRTLKTRDQIIAAESDWRAWLTTVFPGHVDRGFAPYHEEFWEWVWSIRPGERIRPFVAVWPRGSGKSTSVELTCAALAARRARSYALLISETQDQADDHVQNVAGLLESTAFSVAYPEVASRKVGRYGNVRGWRRNRLRTGSGFTIDAIGLDTAARGAKIEEDRPDLLIADDLDGKLDSAATTAKKITTLTHTLLPAGSDAPAVLAVQNKVIPDGIFARLAGGRADFLADRIVSGPYPALRNLAYEQRDGRAVLVAGEPTWAAMDLRACQAKVDEIGLTAFLAECQHEVEAPAGGMFNHLEFRHCRHDEVPDLVRIVVWVDPAVTDKDQSDAFGIQADGLAPNGDIYRLFSWEDRTSPRDALRRAIRKAVELKAEAVGVETDQGGDTWQDSYELAAQELVDAGEITAAEVPAFREAKAGAGHGPKVHRASQMLIDYERGRFVHVLGTHGVLEKALKRFPLTKPLDLVDGGVWSWLDLTDQLEDAPVPAVFAQAASSVRWTR
jgi:phage terminase large subunit-like protein